MSPVPCGCVFVMLTEGRVGGTRRRWEEGNGAKNKRKRVTEEEKVV